MIIAGYGRVSTDKEEQQDSLKNQLEFFKKYAETHGHKLYKLYADEGISGTRLKNREQFLQLLQDASLGLFDMVVVKDVSRMARNTVDLLQSVRKLKSYGVTTNFVNSNMDTLGESEFILTLYGAIAQEESANLSKRVKFTKQINAKKGRVPRRVFGYDHIDNFTLAINEDEAEVVREIFYLFNHEGLGVQRICNVLNSEHRLTKDGGEWNSTGISRILNRTLYIGDYVNNKYEIADYLTGKQVRRPEEDNIHHNRPEWAIISREEFQMTQDLLKKKKEDMHSKGGFEKSRYSNKHIFSTIIKCAECGRSFTRKHYTYINTRVYWKCGQSDRNNHKCHNRVKLNEDELLDEIRKYLISAISDKDKFIDGILNDVIANREETTKKFDKDSIAKKKRALLAKRERYTDMYANGIISMDELKAKILDVDRDLDKLSVDSKQYEASRITEDDARKQTKEYVALVEQFLQLKNVTNSDMRSIIDKILVKSDGTVTVSLKKIQHS